jgi:YD repeat-containing protein
MAATNSVERNENYTYDEVGNRTSSHLDTNYKYRPFNKLVERDKARYTYDNNGNLTSKLEGPAETLFQVETLFIWNEENQLTEVVLPNGEVVNYKYDALGRRIQRTTSSGANERYLYDGSDVLLDLKADWLVATTYLNGPGIDNHLRQTSATTGVSYYLTDHPG